MKDNMERLPYPSQGSRDYFAAVNVCPAGGMDLHWHSFYELEYCISGQGRQLLNGRVYDLSPGSITLLRLTDFHAYAFEKECCLLNIAFSDRLPSELLYRELLSAKGDLTAYLDEPERRVMERLAFTMVTEADSGLGYQDISRRSLLDYVLVLLLRRLDSGALPEPGGRQAHPQPISRALEYINVHFREELPLEQIAKVAGYSKNYFCQLFFDAVGEHYSAYLNRVRAGYSKILLQSTDLSVVDVCMSAGFNSLSQYQRVFKQIVGVSPQEYRVGRKK